MDTPGSDTDPIEELVCALERHGKPSLEWVVRWSRAGEPVAAAWAASEKPGSMVDLLRRVDLVAYRRACTAWEPYTNSSGLMVRGDLPGLAAAVRIMVPIPPTLPDLIARRATTAA